MPVNRLRMDPTATLRLLTVNRLRLVRTISLQSHLAVQAGHRVTHPLHRILPDRPPQPTKALRLIRPPPLSPHQRQARFCPPRLRPFQATSRRKGRGTEAMALLGAQLVDEVARDAAVTVGIEESREQLLGRLAGVELDRLDLLARQHEPRLELEESGDEDEELGGHLEIVAVFPDQELRLGSDVPTGPGQRVA